MSISIETVEVGFGVKREGGWLERESRPEVSAVPSIGPFELAFARMLLKNRIFPGVYLLKIVAGVTNISLCRH